MESRKAVSRDLVPVFAFVWLWDRIPKRPGLDRYQEALTFTAEQFGMTARTLERRYKLHKPVVNRWRKQAWGNPVPYGTWPLPKNPA
ncbi:MAG: hypothetical protein ACT4UQ_03935 [Gammaproteobacteria bacterium]